MNWNIANISKSPYPRIAWDQLNQLPAPTPLTELVVRPGGPGLVALWTIAVPVRIEPDVAFLEYKGRTPIEDLMVRGGPGLNIPVAPWIAVSVETTS